MTALLGYGAHGKDIEAIWNRNRRETLDLYDDNPYNDLPSIDGYRPPFPYFYIGVNNCTLRRKIFNRFDIPEKWLNFTGGASPLVDKTVLIANLKTVWFSVGVVVAPNTTILTDVNVGAHTHINYCSSMTRCTVGRFCTIAPGVVICGDVTIGDETFIGAGAIIKNLVNIGSNCTIGAGAVVVSDVPDGATVMGIPARERRVVNS